MRGYRLSEEANHRLDEIYAFTERHWRAAQAERYLRGLIDKFKEIARRDFPWRSMPAEFGVRGYLCRHEKHLIH